MHRKNAQNPYIELQDFTSEKVEPSLTPPVIHPTLANEEAPELPHVADTKLNKSQTSTSQVFTSLLGTSNKFSEPPYSIPHIEPISFQTPLWQATFKLMEQTRQLNEATRQLASLLAQAQPASQPQPPDQSHGNSPKNG